MKTILPILLTLAFVASRCQAGTIVQARNGAKLVVAFDGAQPEIALADLITVTLTVEGDVDLIVQAPLELASAAPWLLIERSEPTRTSVGARRIGWQLSYRFAPREPGKLAFAFPDVKFHDGSSHQTVAWDPITFTVTTQAGALLPDTGIEDLPPLVLPDHSWLIWPALAASSAGLIVLFLAWRRLFRPSIKRTAAEFALREWQRLVALQLPEQGRSERFITLLTILVRRYLERQCALPARRRTTPEFLTSLSSAADLNAAEKQFLSAFLLRCEAVKFAGMPMSASECGQWAEAARQFLMRRAQASQVS